MDSIFSNTGNIQRHFPSNRPNHITLNGPSPIKKMKFTNCNSNNPMRQNSNDSSVLDAQRMSLPVYYGRQKLIGQIQKHDTLIIIGETGCGKTTQIPQYIFEENLNDFGVIAITQPRRVAATTLSARVAQEAKTTLGDLVGYSIRFEDVTSAHTKMKYLTDGMLLREAVRDENLLNYSIVILDEAHERTVHTDVLFGIVKKAQSTRRRERMKLLKVIIMSATMDVDHFSKYFDSAPVVYLEGRQHDVRILHSVSPQEDYVFSCVVVVFQIHQEAPPNEDILVFLTGQEEIEAVAHSIRTISKDLGGSTPPLKVFPLYSSLSTNLMQKAFRPSPVGWRKVIISTNVAETSVTIPGIKYVVDSGKVKAKVHLPGSGLDLLKVQSISQAQAWQRTGRAGRESAGFCYRIYTKSEFAAMAQHAEPELLRCNLSTVALQLLSIGINISSFDFINKPSKESLGAALLELQSLGAINDVERPSLTPIGARMAEFPIDPRYSRIILASKDFNCSEEILTIVAFLCGESIFTNPTHKREEAKEAHLKFHSSGGDHLTLLQVYRNYKKMTSPNPWCLENFLHMRNIHYALNVKKQLRDICKSAGILIETCGQDFDKVRKCLVTGLFMNVAELQRDKQYFTVGTRTKVYLHPSSVVAGTLPAYVLFSELVQTSKSYIRQLTVVDPDWLTELAPVYFQKHRLSGFTNAPSR